MCSGFPGMWRKCTSSQIFPNFVLQGPAAPLRGSPYFWLPLTQWLSAWVAEVHCMRPSVGQQRRNLFPIPPAQKTSPESPLSESIFETQPLNSILDDNGSSTHGFHIRIFYLGLLCLREPLPLGPHSSECTELDLRKFSSSGFLPELRPLGRKSSWKLWRQAGAHCALWSPQPLTLLR